MAVRKIANFDNQPDALAYINVRVIPNRDQPHTSIDSHDHRHRHDKFGNLVHHHNIHPLNRNKRKSMNWQFEEIIPMQLNRVPRCFFTTPDASKLLSKFVTKQFSMSNKNSKKRHFFSRRNRLTEMITQRNIDSESNRLTRGNGCRRDSTERIRFNTMTFRLIVWFACLRQTIE